MYARGDGYEECFETTVTTPIGVHATLTCVELAGVLPMFVRTTSDFAGGEITIEMLVDDVLLVWTGQTTFLEATSYCYYDAEIIEHHEIGPDQNVRGDFYNASMYGASCEDCRAYAEENDFEFSGTCG